ncbi:GNAT family N-acetyltransferase [Phenylobacterium sp.]|uniref:GNAT family N-acetyltransferase n=1 Tax=Phenylobacterium sp. TaxID=1871053 RepID=UPI0035B2BA1B
MTPDEITALRRAAEAPVSAAMADVPVIAADLSAAFAADPIFNWFLRADSRHEAARLKLFHLLTAMGLLDGKISRPATGGAAAIWLPSESLGPTPFLQQLRALPALLSATGVSRLGRMSALRAMMDAHQPKAPHAYLGFLGDRPDAQGHGVGSRLLAAGLAEVDAQGLPAYLESSAEANVPLYRRHGFEVVEVLRARPDAPAMWAMWRPAQATA